MDSFSRLIMAQGTGGVKEIVLLFRAVAKLERANEQVRTVMRWIEHIGEMAGRLRG